MDNYPTFDYIRREREDEIPDLIERSFYAYTSDALSIGRFEERFSQFQGQNCHVLAAYVPSDFISGFTDEMATLEAIFAREAQTDACSRQAVDFNVLVDLCGIFKRSSVHDIRNVVKHYYGADRFHYVYHIDQADNSDRVLCVNSDNDVRYDEEFYKYLCKTYDAGLRDRVFFFVDNRNVIGKDVPFQLIYQRHFGQPLFKKSVVLAHDLDDFSKIWQAMGRSRSLNETHFSIYKSDIPEGMVEDGFRPRDMKNQALTRQLYVRNCDRKIAGNISSIYLTLIALLNLSSGLFYSRDEIVNTFIDKMENTITGKVARHEEHLLRYVLGTPVPRRIFMHVLMDKFRRSPFENVVDLKLTEVKLVELLRQIVRQKYELRSSSGDVYDDVITFLSGEQKFQVEMSFSKEHAKQKQKQQNKNQDSDAMGIFERKNQLFLSFQVNDYFEYTRSATEDQGKISLSLPSPVPILTVTYSVGRSQHTIDVYPTLQFLYSHHINGGYISEEVQGVFREVVGVSAFNANFLETIGKKRRIQNCGVAGEGRLNVKVLVNFVRQHPQYTIAALESGVYIIGMKDQFNIHNLQSYPMRDRVQFITDEMGFVLYNKTIGRDVDRFGPYFIEQCILLEVLSKQEVAQNVIEYYCNHKEALQRGLESYDESKGTGFLCWRFFMNEPSKIESASVCSKHSNSSDDDDSAGSKRPREDTGGL